MLLDGIALSVSIVLLFLLNRSIKSSNKTRFLLRIYFEWYIEIFQFSKSLDTTVFLP